MTTNHQLVPVRAAQQRGHSQLRRHGEAGFTLMEVAIAVAVVFIGILALFALITSGLDSSAKSVADTQAALFADNVFNGLAAASQTAGEAGLVGGNEQWRVFWDKFDRAVTNITIAAPTTWSGVPTLLEIKPPPPFGPKAGKPLTIRYTMVPQHTASSNFTPIVNHSLLYRLEVDFPPNRGITPLTDPSNTIAMVTLQVWDGEFSAANTNDALVFYSEFDNPGDL